MATWYASLVSSLSLKPLSPHSATKCSASTRTETCPTNMGGVVSTVIGPMTYKQGKNVSTGKWCVNLLLVVFIILSLQHLLTLITLVSFHLFRPSDCFWLFLIVFLAMSSITKLCLRFLRQQGQYFSTSMWIHLEFFDDKLNTSFEMEVRRAEPWLP